MQDKIFELSEGENAYPFKFWHTPYETGNNGEIEYTDATGKALVVPVNEKVYLFACDEVQGKVYYMLTSEINQKRGEGGTLEFKTLSSLKDEDIQEIDREIVRFQANPKTQEEAQKHRPNIPYKRVSVLRKGLDDLIAQGYKIDKEKIIENNLSEHFDEMVKEYNVLGLQKTLEVREVLRIIKDSDSKGIDAFQAIENEVKKFYGQFDQNERGKEAFASLGYVVVWNVQDKPIYEKVKGQLGLVEGRERDKIIRLSPTKYQIMVTINDYKDSYSGKEYSFNTEGFYERGKSMDALFQHVCGTKTDVDAMFMELYKEGYHKADSAIWKETPTVVAFSDKSRITMKVYKNGKIEFKANKKNSEATEVIEKLNKATEDYFDKYRKWVVPLRV